MIIDMEVGVIDATSTRQALTSAWKTLAGLDCITPPQTNLFNYFTALDEVLIRLSRYGMIDVVEAIMIHVGYLADTVGYQSAELLGGRSFSADSQVIIDTLNNISAEFAPALRRARERPPEGIPDDVFALILEAESKLDGWCSRDKALLIASSVLRDRPRVCVEIGVYGGRSLVPCAAALRHIGAGIIYGIEAWSHDVAIENVTNKGNDEWWSNVDFARIKREFYRFVASTGLTTQVRVIEAPSGRAASLFDDIDFLHIDGSHSMVNAAEDVILYVRKVRRGGIVIFDDINWKSTAPARELIAVFCESIAVLKDPKTGMEVCEVLRRR